MRMPMPLMMPQERRTAAPSNRNLPIRALTEHA